MHELKRPLPVSARGGVAIGCVVAGLWAAYVADLAPSDLIPSSGGMAVAGEFFSSAVRPALRSQATGLGVEVPSLLVTALKAAWTTVAFAASAMSLAVIIGLVLGFPASSAWWEGDPSGGGRLRAVVGRTLGPLLWAVTRVWIALMRSVHELIWAVLFLAAFGLNNLAAVVAIAIPFGGTLAKVFSEMIDEVPRDVGEALRASGASPLQVFCFGLLPRAIPDMAAYAFYRFECALRASAVLGFFGFPTLGLYIRLSFDNLFYREVWTYLYTLFLLVALVDWWSGALRRRFVA